MCALFQHQNFSSQYLHIAGNFSNLLANKIVVIYKSKPHVIVGHAVWGETLYAKDMYADH